MRTPKEWHDYFYESGEVKISDIEQIQAEAIESYKKKFYNVGNIARAERIRSRMGSGMAGTF